MLTRTRTYTLAAVIALAVLVAAGAPGAGGPPTAAAPSPASVSPEVRTAVADNGSARVLISLAEPAALRVSPLDVVTLRSQVASAQTTVLDAMPENDFTLVYRYQAIPALAATVTATGLEELEQQSAVAEIVLDGIGTAALAESVPLIHADEAHAGGLTGEGVVVAVLDSGIDTDHPDLQDDILYEACFLGGGGCPGGDHPAEDDNGHGTNVTGIVTGGGVVASLGVAPDAQIAAYKILNSSGSGFFSDWTAALDDIIANHPEVDVINMSLQSSSGCPNGPMATAIETLRQQGVATFIATGNRGVKNGFTVPVCIESGISVGAAYDTSIGSVSSWKGISCTDATTETDQVTCWSNSAESLDLIGPGARIRAAGRGGGTSAFMGTSQASPHAAGVAALMLEANPSASVDEIEELLKATGRLVTDDLHDGEASTYRTTPRVDARAALLVDADDADGDGCRTSEELGTDPRHGGLRNPLNPWDFYDTNGDGTVNVLDDLMAVANAFGSAADPRYDPALDRSPPPPGAHPWDLGPPDGAINIADDVLGVAAQFGHSCSGVVP